MFLGQGAEVLGIDRDPEALGIARARLGEGLRTVEAPYASEEALAAVEAFAPDLVLLDLGVSSRQLDDDTRGFTFRPGASLDMRMGREGPTGADILNEYDDEALAAVAAFAPDLILLDLGVSSRQLDDDARGFTFRPGASLDMRMGREGPTGADILNESEDEELADIFHEWGDERKARPLARAIVRRRATSPFATSDDFVNAIRSVLGPRSGPGDFARLFQALRIAVNDELAGLETALPAFFGSLQAGGHLAVISYHSGEDRVTKHLFQEWARACICPPSQPFCTCRGKALGTLVPRKPILPDAAEIAANPRARSAKLRIFRKAE